MPEPPSLFGREREQAALRERLSSALGGQGGLVLIGGEAGVGKTALTESLAYQACCAARSSASGGATI